MGDKGVKEWGMQYAHMNPVGLQNRITIEWISLYPLINQHRSDVQNGQEDDVNYKCEVKEQPRVPVLSIRTRASVKDLGQVMGRCYAAIGEHLAKFGELPAGKPFTAYYNMDMQDLDVEIGIPVSKALPSQGEILASAIPGGRHASTVYTGPYTQMEPAYQALLSWMKEHDCTPTRAARRTR